MGHRANFVLIEGGKAKAWDDQWAALACTLMLPEGPKRLRKQVAQLFSPTRELMDWGFAEAGFLIDYDEKVCIAFGFPDVDPSELPDDDAAEQRALLDALRAGWPAFVKHLGAVWAGFTMVWDPRGVDAFAAHLALRGIRTLTVQPASHPKSIAKQRPVVVVVGDTARAKPAAAATKAAAAKPAVKHTRGGSRRARRGT